MNPGRERTAVILALGAVGLWSTVAVAFKTALTDLAPVDLLTLATFVSWLALGIALMASRVHIQRLHRSESESAVSGLTVGMEGTAKSGRTKAPVLTAALLGLLNPLLYYGVLFSAYDRLPAQAAQPLNYTWPLFLAVLAAPLAGRRPSGRELAAILVSLVGVILISWRPSDSGEAMDVLGILLALGSGIIWALYWLIGNRLDMDGGPRLFTGFTLATFILGILWWRRGFPVPTSTPAVIATIWVGLFEMGITFLLWNGALSRADRPARLGSLVYLGPFISLVWIRLVLGEAIRPATIAGLAVIVVGILYGRNLILRPSPKSLGAEDAD